VIGLRQALNRTGQLWKRYKKNQLPISLAHKEWEYKEHSGAGNQCVAALKAFGLLEVDGKDNERRIDRLGVSNHESSQVCSRMVRAAAKGSADSIAVFRTLEKMGRN
jgi:hypothetical protein